MRRFSPIFLSIAFCVVTALCVALPAHAQTTGPKIETFYLKNGMEVVLVPNHRVPAVSHSLWIKVGSGDEVQGKTGLAHYLEHMMFKGTARYAEGEYSRILSRLGGQKNATTGYDYTFYYVNIAKEHLPLVMDIESDRFQTLSPKPESFPKEREVIIEERRMRIETRGLAQLSEQMRATLFQNSPYHNPSIGWRQEMAGLTEQDVMDFYRRYYVPANMVLIVAGDISREELQPLAEKYYGGIPSGQEYKRNWRKEPKQIAPRFVELYKNNVTQRVWERDYITPSLVDGDTKLAIPLMVLGQILGGGQTSRLYQSLVVKQQIATSTDVDYNIASYGPGEFNIEVVPNKTTSMDQAAKAVDKEIRRMMREPVSDDELDRVKTAIKADSVYDQDSLEGIAFMIGRLRSVGLDASFYDKWPSLVDAVTKEQIMQAARAVFDNKRSVTGYLLPKPPEEKEESDD